MKKFKGAIALLLVAVIVSVFVACGSNAEYTDKEVTLTQVVTDKNGETVTDKNGEPVTEEVNAVVVTDSNGKTVTELVTNSDGTAQTKPNGEKIYQPVTVDPEKTTKKESTTKKKDKTTKKETTTKKPNSDNTKPNTSKPSDTTTTTTEPPTAPDDEEPEETDLTIRVVLPFFAAEDAREYKLVLTIDNGENKEPTVLNWSFVGCKGQEIEIAVPKEHKGKKGTFSVNVQGKEYNVKRTIKNNLSVEFETIIVIDGEDD